MHITTIGCEKSGVLLLSRLLLLYHAIHRTSIGKSNGLFHRPLPPTPCHSAPAGARAGRRPAPLAPPTLASTPPGRARGVPRHRAPPRAAGHGQDGWLGTGCRRGWGGWRGLLQTR